MRQEYIPLILINSTLLQRDPDSVSYIRHLFCTLRQRMAHHGRPQKRKQVNPHRAIRILQRNLFNRSIVHPGKIDSAFSHQAGTKRQTLRGVMVSTDDKSGDPFHGQFRQKRIKNLNRFRAWNRTVINIPGKQNAIRFLNFRSMENLRQNVFLIFNHRKFIDSFSDVKIG